MELTSHYVGRRSEPLELEVTPRWSMNYAAGVADDNPWYFDDERPGGTLAPPMLSVALTWKMSEGFGQHWRQADFPAEVLARQVHYSEWIEFLQPLRPGQRLRIEGEVAAILPHPAGTHLVLEYTAYDAANAAVFREYIGGMLRGVRCVDGGAGADRVPDLPRVNNTPEPLWERRLHVDRLAAHVYDGCADISFAIHTSPAFAHAVGLPDPIYMGTATLALAQREILNAEGGGDPRRVRGICCNFTGMVLPGTDIAVQAVRRVERADGGADVHFVVLDAEGKRAIRNGSIALAPPTEA